MKKTLFLSDLDGTLLQPDERLSDFTRETLTRLIGNGMLFSYATARSYSTARHCTEGLTAEIPLIVHNGTFIIDNRTGKILHKNTFQPEQAAKIFSLLSQNGVAPIVYSILDEKERFSYNRLRIPDETWAFILTRKGDGRERMLLSDETILDREIYYFACIDREERLFPVWKELCAQYRSILNCVYQKDIYSGHQWLEIMPASASKAHAARQLKTLTGAKRLVVFGDGKNDLPLFEAGDEGYAVENADPALKEKATAVIGSNTNNGVADWLLENSGYA